MTTTSNLSGNEIPKRLFGSKPSSEEKRKVLKDLILTFNKDDKKKKKKKKKTTGIIIRRKNLEDMNEALIPSPAGQRYIILKNPSKEQLHEYVMNEVLPEYAKRRISAGKSTVVLKYVILNNGDVFIGNGLSQTYEGIKKVGLRRYKSPSVKVQGRMRYKYNTKKFIPFGEVIKGRETKYLSKLLGA